MTTAASAPSDRAPSGNHGGGHWWLAPETHRRPDGAFSTNGDRGQFTVVVPSHGLVIVRRDLDYGRQGFSQRGLTQEVLQAFR